MDHLLHDIHGQWVTTVAAARASDGAIEPRWPRRPFLQIRQDARLIDAVAYADEDWTLWDERLGREASRVDLRFTLGGHDCSPCPGLAGVERPSPYST